MICSHCGQQNPDNYQFCASCGARLANVSPAGPAASPRVQQPAPNSLRIQPVDRPPSPARSAPATRDVSYLLEDDDPKASRVAPVIVVLSLLALGAFAWWELRPMLQTGGVTPAKPPAESSADLSSTPSAATSAPAQKAPPVEVAQGTTPSDGAPPTSDAESQTANSQATEANQPRNEEVPPAPSIEETSKQEPPGSPSVQGPADNPVAAALPARPSVPVAHKPVPKPIPRAPAPDPIKQAEAYLYGRGVPQDCERALSILKGEADKSNARARSALGSMYATGHCVSRDLPTAYRYFALVLRTDPENGVASQNLESLWKQMTPPERQAATKQ